jgi:hypothetical protein
MRAPSQASGTLQELLGLSSGGHSYAQHMGVGRQFVAHLARPSASTFAKSAAGAVGIVLPVATFGWFATIVPAVVSLAVAVGVEKHPDARANIDESVPEAVTDAARAKLSVNVRATTHDGTRCALDVARRLIGGLGAQVVLLLPRLASLAGGFDTASQGRNALVDKHRTLAADVGVHVKVLFRVCHRYDDIVHQMRGRSSLLIVRGQTRTWWPTREERLMSRLAADGYPVVLAQVGAAHPLSAVVDTARS